MIPQHDLTAALATMPAACGSTEGWADVWADVADVERAVRRERRTRRFAAAVVVAVGLAAFAVGGRIGWWLAGTGQVGR